MNELWRQQLKQKMADYRRPAPELSWDAVKQAMTQQPSPSKARSLTSKPIQRIAAAVALLLAVGISYWSLRQGSSDSKQLADTFAYQESVTKEYFPTPSTIPATPSAPIHSVIPATPTRSITPTCHGSSTAPTDSTSATLAEVVSEPTTTDTVGSATPTDQSPTTPIVVRKPVFPVVPNRHGILSTQLRTRRASSHRLMAKVYLSSSVLDPAWQNNFGDNNNLQEQIPHDPEPNPNNPGGGGSHHIHFADREGIGIPIQNGQHR